MINNVIVSWTVLLTCCHTMLCCGVCLDVCHNHVSYENCILYYLHTFFTFWQPHHFSFSLEILWQNSDRICLNEGIECRCGKLYIYLENCTG